MSKCVCVTGKILDLINLSRREHKVLLKAQYLRSFSVFVAEGFYLSVSTTQTQHVFFSSNILLLLYPPSLFTLSPFLELECQCVP